MTTLRVRRIIGLAGLALSCSACAAPSMNRLADVPSHSEHVARASSTPLPPAAPSASDGVSRLGPRRAAPIRDSGFQLASYNEGAMGPACPPEAIEVCPPEPRYPVAGPQPFAVGMAACDAACQPSPFAYPDEYLCDGGDRANPVHYEGEWRQGLDTEDTVAEFTDHRGKERTSKSNRVCVYSPRFSAVRTVSLPHEEGTFVEVGGVSTSDSGAMMRTRLAMQAKQKTDAVGGVRMRSRASGLESERVQGEVAQNQKPQLADKILNTFEDLSFFREGTLDQAGLAQINLGLQAAVAWNREEYPIIQAKIEAVATGVSEIRASALTVIDDRPSDQPAQLRLVKVADQRTAQTGDVITFTIRYDNLGPTPATSVRIVDNLTPRLAYVVDSATCDREGRLDLDDNGEGSHVLTWVIDEVIPPGEGGVVTFQAQVR